MFIFIVGGNLIVIIAITRTRGLQTMANLLAANLAVADLTLGMKIILNIIPLVQPPKKEYKYYMCCLQTWAWTITCNASGLFLIGK